MMAAHIAKTLCAKRSGSGWVARCPAHQDKTPSLRISEKGGKILVHCFAGCSQGEVIAALRNLGLWPEQQRKVWSAAERRDYGRRRARAEVLARRALLWRLARVRRLEIEKATFLDANLAKPDENNERGWAEAANNLFVCQSLSGAALIGAYNHALRDVPSVVENLIAEAVEHEDHAERVALLALEMLVGSVQ